MATLTDPGDTGAGDEYVKNSTNQFPDVAVKPGYDTPRSLTGDDADRIFFPNPNGDGNPKPPDVPTASPFTVKPSDIRYLEQSIMSELDTQVAAYPAFKKLIADTEGWIFLVQDPKYMIPYEQANPTSYTSQYAGESYKADFTDPDPASTQKFVDSQNALVRALADSYRLVGELVALLNNAAQNYVEADKAIFDAGSSYDDYTTRNLPHGIQIK